MRIVPEHKQDFDACSALSAAENSMVACQLSELLTWLQDMNWPVATLVEARIKSLGAPAHRTCTASASRFGRHLEVLARLFATSKSRPISGQIIAARVNSNRHLSRRRRNRRGSRRCSARTPEQAARLTTRSTPTTQRHAPLGPYRACAAPAG
jgi:Domain of unknown function (DUF5071)